MCKSGNLNLQKPAGQGSAGSMTYGAGTGTGAVSAPLYALSSTTSCGSRANAFFSTYGKRIDDAENHRDEGQVEPEHVERVIRHVHLEHGVRAIPAEQPAHAEEG